MNAFIEGLPFYDMINTFINETLGLEGHVQSAFDFFLNLSAPIQLISIAVAAIIFIMGFFELIKKLSKIIVVVGILVGLYLLYDGGALDGIIG